MYKDILRSIAGIEVFPIVSLVLFVSVFAIVLLWTSRLDGPRLARLARLPLDDTDTPPRPDSSDRAQEGAPL
jgi:hypothetical protein